MRPLLLFRGIELIFYVTVKSTLIRNGFVAWLL